MHNAEDVLTGLRKGFYGDKEWAFLPQVANATGGGYGRTADAVALNCWPSRGMELHGIEVKCYGGDFKREMAKPEKAEAIAQYCDRWYIAIPAEGIVKPAELPPTWGLYVVDEKPRMLVMATKLEPKPLTRAFIAAVMRAAQKDAGISTTEHRRLMNAHWEEAIRVGRRSMASSRDDERVRWQIESLTQLEEQAKRALKSIQRELVDVKKMAIEPPFSDETCDAPQAINAVDPHL